MQVSLHALCGNKETKTMTLEENYGRHKLHILVYLGNNHNFLSYTIAQKLNFDEKPTGKVEVSMANGHSLCFKLIWQNFTWCV